MRKQNILIVDDNRTNVKVLASKLRQSEYNLAVALNGADAIDVVKSNPVDLILLDIMMPVMDGFEVCRKLKAMSEYKEIPIIFITAMVESESIVKGFELGGADYVTKPFNEEELLARVKMHLSLKQSKEKIKDQNKQLKEQNKELNKLNATKDKLFSIIAHDLRGPLSSFPLFFGALSESDTFPEEHKGLFLDMQLQSESVFSLLDNLLNWAKNQQDTYIYAPVMVDVHNAVAVAFNLLSKMAAKKTITLINQINNKEEVLVDKDLINLVIRNIVANAIKFTPQNGQVVVSSFSEHNSLCVSIKDNGVGMSKDAQVKLFRDDVFYSTYGTENEKGSGLGITMCREFIKKWGGRIWVESAPGEGSDFKFTIPLVLR